MYIVCSLYSCVVLSLVDYGPCCFLGWRRGEGRHTDNGVASRLTCLKMLFVEPMTSKSLFTITGSTTTKKENNTSESYRCHVSLVMSNYGKTCPCRKDR